jgi:UDP-glucose 6-dehydrogenase
MHVAIHWRRLCWFGFRRLFADFGHAVCCVDKDEAKIAALEAGRIPIYGRPAGNNVRAKRWTMLASSLTESNMLRTPTPARRAPMPW